MRKILIIFFLLSTSVLRTSGQTALDPGTRPGELFLRIKSICFIKNNEYYNPLIEGYTLPGFFFQPELVYKASGKVTLKAGTHIIKYAGTEKFFKVRPVFSTSLKLTDNTLLTIGSLSGSDSHRMFDPHFNSERLYNAFVEDGFQLTCKNEHIFSDTWLSWENFIFKGDAQREIFTFGESFRYSSQPVLRSIRFEIPVQIQLKHFGGQISNYSEHVQTFFNLAAGLGINTDIAEKRCGEAGIEYLLFMNKVFAGEGISGISHGHSSWVRLHYAYKALFIGAAYWKAHDYYAPNGNAIFGSISDYQTDIVVPNRRIINNSVSIRFLPESYLELFLGVDTYYDIDRHRLDNAVTLHLNFDKLFRLATLKH